MSAPIALLGIEVIGLGDEHGIEPPFRMTVDLVDDGVLERWQIIGETWTKRERTSEEVAPFVGGLDNAAADEVLMHRAAEKIAPVIRRLQADQLRLMHGASITEWVVDSEPETVEAVTRAFHESYERQAPEHGYKTRESSAVPWWDVPAANRELMRAVVRDLFKRGVIA